MLYRNLLIGCREAILGILLKDSDTPKQASECFLNPPCGCSNPGTELQCEDCPYLEACLSRFKTLSSKSRTIKRHVTTNTRS